MYFPDLLKSEGLGFNIKQLSLQGKDSTATSRLRMKVAREAYYVCANLLTWSAKSRVQRLALIYELVFHLIWFNVILPLP